MLVLYFWYTLRVCQYLVLKKKLFSIFDKDKLHCQLTYATLSFENTRNKKRIEYHRNYGYNTNAVQF